MSWSRIEDAMNGEIPEETVDATRLLSKAILSMVDDEEAFNNHLKEERCYEEETTR